MKDTINNLVVKMFDASVLGGESYDSLLRTLSFELDMDDEEVEGLFNNYMDREFSTHDNIQALVAHLYYLYLEAN